jgi:hypothetical protein
LSSSFRWKTVFAWSRELSMMQVMAAKMPEMVWLKLNKAAIVKIHT